MPFIIRCSLIYELLQKNKSAPDETGTYFLIMLTTWYSLIFKSRKYVFLEYYELGDITISDWIASWYLHCFHYESSQCTIITLVFYIIPSHGGNKCLAYFIVWFFEMYFWVIHLSSQCEAHWVFLGCVSLPEWGASWRSHGCVFFPMGMSSRSCLPAATSGLVPLWPSAVTISASLQHHLWIRLPSLLCWIPLCWSSCLLCRSIPGFVGTQPPVASWERCHSWSMFRDFVNVFILLLHVIACLDWRLNFGNHFSLS